MFKDILEKIKIKDRDKVAAQAREYFLQFRNWIQNNGEVASLISLFIGIGVVLFFKQLVVLIIVVGLAGYLIWEISEPTQTKEHAEEDHKEML